MVKIVPPTPRPVTEARALRGTLRPGVVPRRQGGWRRPHDVTARGLSVQCASDQHTELPKAECRKRQVAGLGPWFELW